MVHACLPRPASGIPAATAVVVVTVGVGDGLAASSAGNQYIAATIMHSERAVDFS
jgi:hypothetical protein